MSAVLDSSSDGGSNVLLQAIDPRRDSSQLHRLKQAFHKARHLEALLLRRKVVADELVDPFAGGFDFSQLNERLAGFGAELVACDVDFQ